jgi:hypothetical protein
MSEKNANIVHEFDNFMKNFCMIAFGLVLIVLAIVILLTFFILWIDFTGWLFQVITRLVKSARTVLIDIWKCFLYLCGMEILFILIIFAFFALKLVISMFCIFLLYNVQSST